MPQREVITRETAEPLTEAHMALAMSIASWTEKASRLETEIPVLGRQVEALRLQARELNAKVALIQALGGGYHDEPAAKSTLKEPK